MNSILCTICDRPLCIYKIQDFRRHYRSKHPGKRMPTFDGGENNSKQQQIRQVEIK